ncbi:hypothetical protein FHR81_002159 [Actinoalloteichus hoggarensis]|uniref:Uncharacterized protein n=1 Tax=Actinoalloteichus hoggarensis TaxID=1470176 RepID=A0A221W652_9PSEU|nr:hypothetical protein [Actinoalloteichus hoggarensis]ASO21191.1 hypothetical protein AHOG_17830 [Actinoalloteichus hoggarensis]MBB5921121.1 hypothetical protein [Actinoalloteichus hoggarensis]
MAETRPAERSDEDELVIPTSWHAGIMPRRGGVHAAVALDVEASDQVRWILSTTAPRVQAALDDPRSPAPLAAAARAALAGSPTPAGVAILAALTSRVPVQGTACAHAEFADAWTHEHGIVFAAEAACLLACVTVVGGSGDRPPHLGSRPDGDFPADGALEVLPILARMRALMAVATREDHERVVATLAAHRIDEAARVPASFLVPSRTDWVDADCAASAPSWWPLLIRSVSTLDQLTTLADHVGPATLLRDERALRTVVSAVGAASAPVLAAALDDTATDVESHRRIVEAMALLPSDTAFDLLAARAGDRRAWPALSEMMRRFPVRALRRLAAAATDDEAGSIGAGSDGADELLRRHVVTAASVVERVSAELPAASRARVTAARAAVAEANEARRTVAPASALPALLVEPPWRRPRDPATTDVSADPTPMALDVHWADGERQEWAAAPLPVGERRWGQATDWAREVHALRSRRFDPAQEAAFFAQAPRELVASTLARWRFRRRISAGTLRLLVARFGRAVSGQVLGQARRQPDFESGLLLQPFVGTPVAELMADWLSRTAMRPHAVTWLDRHGITAVRALLPAVFGQAGARRSQAERALRVAAAGRVEEVVAMTEDECGGQAAVAVRALLEIGPADELPDRVPDPSPGWLHRGLLPPIRLRGRTDVLPASAVEHVLTMLAMCRFGQTYAGVEAIRDACDPRSLADFGWALLLEWQRCARPPVGDWVLPALAAIGDDETVRRLVPLIRAWPDEGHRRRAVHGLTVLAGIGTDLALMYLHVLAERLRFPEPRPGV